MNKLQVGCVVEDAKVSLEDIFERIETEWTGIVQSTDTVSFQKLLIFMSIIIIIISIIEEYQKIIVLEPDDLGSL